MTLTDLVSKHGVPAVAKACGVSESYVKQCLAPNSKTNIRRVKLVNAVNKLNS